MAPFYVGDTLFRIVENRADNVKMAHVFYLEYLGMLEHYGALDDLQKKKFKSARNAHKVGVMKARQDATPEELKECAEWIRELQADAVGVVEDRDSKIAEFKAKKMLSSQLDELKNYRDEDMKRAFYMAQILHLVITVFEQLRLVQMELQILAHKAGLTAE